MVILDHRVHKDREVMPGKMVLREFQGPQVHLETTVIVVLQDLEVHEVFKAYREHPVIREHQEKMVKLANQDQLDQLVSLVLEASVGSLEKEVQSAHQELRVYEENTELKEMMAHRVQQVRLV